MANYKVLAFMPLFALSACCSVKTNVQSNQNQTAKLDTLRVLGTSDVSLGSAYAMPAKYKFVRCVDKSGYETDLRFEVYSDGIDDGAYIERGDTIVVRGNELVKNLTMARIKSEYGKTK